MKVIFEIIMKLIISFSFGLVAAILATNIAGILKSNRWTCLASVAVGLLFSFFFAIAWIFEIYVVMLLLFILFTLVYVLWLLISWLKRWLKK